ncbi:MAG: hypothetical protein R3229_11150 [Alphaproteobacteria bacterium]|nr:hypothetical protein [Alphaproteobacteria bacterium]
MASVLAKEIEAALAQWDPAVKLGDKLYVSEVSDAATATRHHFAGEVTGLSGDVAKLDGYDFVYDATSGNFTRKPWRSERILRIDNALVIYVLPDTCDLDALRHECDGAELVITDGAAFRLADTRYSGR